MSAVAPLSTVVRRALAAGAAVTLPLAGSMIFAPVAAADVTTFTDKGDHVTTVRISHGPKNIAVKAKVGKYKIGSSFTFWLDTDPDDPGPEYKIQVDPNTEVAPIRKVESFTAQGKKINCDYRASADVYGDRYVSITVPRTCLGKPDRVRVSVRAKFAVQGPDIVDWGPGPKKFSSWVSR